jgi:predicted exporter
LTGYHGISNFIPSLKRQRENRQLVADMLVGQPLAQMQSRLGIPGDQQSYPPEETGAGLTYSAINDTEILTTYVLDNKPGNWSSLILLDGVAQTRPLVELVSEDQALAYIDHVQDIAEVLQLYRERITLFFGVAVLAIFGLLWHRYGKYQAFRIMGVAVVAVVTTPFILAVFGETFTFFSVMGLILVFAIGLDYALFCGSQRRGEAGATLLANGLSAASTIFAFGFLSFSSIYALHSFGVHVFVGISVAFFLAPYAQSPVLKNSQS